ncbi:hypothetical protein Tco_0745788 [Tanacetum coccineum]
MIPAATPLVGFSREIIWPLGQISLLVKIGDEEHSTFAWMNFMVVRSPSPYNGIIGRPRVSKIRAIPSTAHRMLKFPVAGGIVTLRSINIIPLECTMVSGPGVPQHVINQVAEEKIQVAIHQEYSEQTVAIGSISQVTYAVLFYDDMERISIVIVNTKEYHSECSGKIITMILRRTLDNSL